MAMAESALEIALSETRFLEMNDRKEWNCDKKKGILSIILKIALSREKDSPVARIVIVIKYSYG
jgi:hypothetical protein